MPVQSSFHPAARWKTVLLPGLFGGLLLTVLQVAGTALLMTGPVERLDSFLPHRSPATMLLGWFWYLLIPAVQAFLVATWTHQPRVGSQAGKLAGRVSVLIFLVITLTYPASWDLIGLSFPLCRLTPMCGYGTFIVVILSRAWAVCYHLIGLLLAILGAFLGSRIAQRLPSFLRSQTRRKE